MNKHSVPTMMHYWIKDVITPNSIVLDATAGNGNDTYFLCRNAQHVYAFDIQRESKDNTLERCSKFDNLTFFLMSHDQISQKVSDPLDIAVFNLGYLPKSDMQIITKSESTLAALTQVLKLLKLGGKIYCACYTGHLGGSQEHKDVLAWIIKNDLVYRSYQQKENGPILYEISRRTT